MVRYSLLLPNLCVFFIPSVLFLVLLFLMCCLLVDDYFKLLFAVHSPIPNAAVDDVYLHHSVVTSQ